ncbi:MAG: transcription termination/antitermination protein NusG [Rickettsiales bacterium]|nr:transcription termination/antitermination protein NusG [Rickettsiales bacterium]
MAEAEKNEAEDVAVTEAEAVVEETATEEATADASPAEDDVAATDLADVVAEVNAEEAPKPKNGSGRSRWYIVHAYSGFEAKIKQQIEEKAIQIGVVDQIEEIVVPTEHVMEVRRGKKVEAEKKFFPGYLLIKMQLTDAAWHMVKNTDKVTGFLGADGKPQRVPQAEVDAIFKQMEEGVSGSSSGIIYEIGEQVKITDGPFDSFTGTVEDVDEDREKVKVSVAIFGRATPVELDYTQVQKV